MRRLFNTTLCLLLFACSEQPDSIPEDSLCEEYVFAWYETAKQTFFQHSGTEALADQLTSAISASESSSGCTLTPRVQLAQRLADNMWEISLSPRPSAGESTAQQERRETLGQLLLIHARTVLGQVAMLPELSGLQPHEQRWQDVNQSLDRLIAEHPSLGSRPNEVYFANSATGLLGYRYRNENEQAYVIFNLSFDQHEMPLPFGFMSSTKVALWRSDDTQVRHFVTRQPMWISALSAAIVIVP